MEGLILQSIQKYNIFPVTSCCDSRCVFCSHQQNPPGVAAYSFGHRNYQNMLESLEYLDDKQKIVIGESATKLIEGEPFSHPKFLDILSKLRENYPATALSITTNGNYLDQNTIQFLQRIEPVEINLSINALSPDNRKRIMGKRAQDLKYILPLLKESKMTYHGSLVALPWITGWKEIAETIAALEKNDAATIRVFLPGYTKFAPVEMVFPLKLWDELYQFIIKLREKHEVPIILEPPQINDLTPIVIGVIKNSPAWKANVQVGDIILRVNDLPVYSRVEAFENCLPLSHLNLKIKRAGKTLELNVVKEKNQSPGFVMDYDISPQTTENILTKIKKYQPRKVLLLTSQLGYNVVRKSLERFFPEGLQLYFEKVPSRFFGGSIMAGGLLVVDDFKAAITDWLDRHEEYPYLILLPAAAFDYLGKDLTGKPYWEIEDFVNCPVEIA